MPGLNLDFHCETPLNDQYPSLLRCPEVEQAIIECHRNDKKVLLSLGGPGDKYGFQNEAQIRLFAYRLWNLFMEGNTLIPLRPFGR